MESSSKATEADSLIPKKSYAFHAHDVREVLSLIGAQEQGLTKKEVEHRRMQHGPNEFTEEKQDTLFDHFITQFKSPLALVLVLAFFVTLSLQEYVDATVIGVALLVAVFVGVLQEGKASQAFSTLARSQIHKATVIREGIKSEIEASELVIGDIVVLQGGMKVPADIRIMQAKQLSINVAVLTGEWVSVDKQSKPVAVGSAFAEQVSMAWKGTYVASGYGTGVVVTIGDNTAVGKLAQSVQDVEDAQTPLQEEMMKISRLMLYLIVGLVLLIFFVGLWQSQSLHDMLLLSIAIAVAAVPEGLPAAVTIVLAIGMETLLKRGGLVRNLLAAETLGSTTYILTDKTGTLTQAKMSVTGVITQMPILIEVLNKQLFTVILFKSL